MKLAAMFLVFVSTTVFANENTAFKDYRNSAKKQYIASEKTLIEAGDPYVKQHTQVAERLSLADMLPIKNKDLPAFCKNFRTEVANYYNIDAKRVSSIKSPIYLEFSKMVRGQCYKISKK